MVNFQALSATITLVKVKIDCAGLDIKTLLDEVEYDIDVLDEE